MTDEDLDASEMDEHLSTPLRAARRPEDVFPYLRIPQATVAEKPSVTHVRPLSPSAHSIKRSLSHEERRYPWLSAQAEQRLEEIEQEVASKLVHKTLRSEIQRLWSAAKLGKQANYLQFISLLRSLKLIEGSEVTLINSLWKAAGGEEQQGVDKKIVVELLEALQADPSLLQQDDTRCSEDSVSTVGKEARLRRTRTKKL